MKYLQYEYKRRGLRGRRMKIQVQEYIKEVQKNLYTLTAEKFHEEVAKQLMYGNKDYWNTKPVIGVTI